MDNNSSLKYVLAILFVLCASVDAWTDRRVRYIDRADPSTGIQNFLFRTDEPRSPSDTFAYEDIVKFVTIRAKEEANITIPQDFFLIDLCLLSEVIEWTDIAMEKDFFEANETLGSFINWPIIGSLINPDDMPDSLRKDMSKDLDKWSYDELPNLMEKIRTLLYTPMDKPVVIIVHCEAGTDRTGEVSGSYYIRYLNWTFSEALDYDSTISNRSIDWGTMLEFKWYCYYLYYWVPGYSYLDCSITNSTKNEDIPNSKYHTLPMDDDNVSEDDKKLIMQKLMHQKEDEFKKHHMKSNGKRDFL